MSGTVTFPHDELPKAINPDTGYAITCNQRVAGHDYPYYVGLSFTPEYRARRVQTQILSLAPGMATVDDMARIHAERVSNPARVFTEALINGSRRLMMIRRKRWGCYERGTIAWIVINPNR